MGLIEDLYQLEHGDGGPDCSACRAILAQMGETEKAALTSALAGNIGARRLNLVLRANGITVGADTISRHRNEGHDPARG